MVKILTAMLGMTGQMKWLQIMFNFCEKIWSRHLSVARDQTSIARGELPVYCTSRPSLSNSSLMKSAALTSSVLP